MAMVGIGWNGEDANTYKCVYVNTPKYKTAFNSGDLMADFEAAMKMLDDDPPLTITFSGTLIAYLYHSSRYDWDCTNLVIKDREQ